MSSFTISKREYMRAAGFCAGLADVKEAPFFEPALWVFSEKVGRPAGDDEFRAAFSAVYSWNAESVRRQYNDEEREDDQEEYAAEFAAAKEAAKKAYRAGDLERLVLGFNKFCACVNYQTEDPELSKKANRVLYRIEHSLLQVLAKKNKTDLHDFWGEFPISNK